MDQIASIIHLVDENGLAADLFYLAKDPLPCRCLNVTLPGHSKCTLYEADEFIEEKLGNWGYRCEPEAVDVQAFVAEGSEAPGFRKPQPSEPWYRAYNLYFKKAGRSYPGQVILVVSHKDTQSWLGSAPGAYDNAVGTVATMEIARLLREYDADRSIWFLFCNEEHWPWTSVAAAADLASTDLDVIAVLNLDSIGGKSSRDRAAGRMVNVTRYSTPEGEKLADLMAALNHRHQIGLNQEKYYSARPNDDDGSFVLAGFPAAVLNIGSFPYAEPNYHTTLDTPENVDLQNVKLATQLGLAAVLHLDIHGRCETSSM